MYQDATKTYQQANYLTATPMKLVMMCYDGAIGSLKLARENYVAKDYEAKGRALNRTIDIIQELNSSLDLKKGGKVAENLRNIYTYMTQTLIEADLKRDIDMFDQVISMLEELESAWKAIAMPAVHVEERKTAPVMIDQGVRPPVAMARGWSV
jgi:flagellar protein FliS